MCLFYSVFYLYGAAACQLFIKRICYVILRNRPNYICSFKQTNLLTECENHADERCAQAHCSLARQCVSNSGFCRERAIAYASDVISQLPVSSCRADWNPVTHGSTWSFDEKLSCCRETARYWKSVEILSAATRINRIWTGMPFARSYVTWC